MSLHCLCWLRCSIPSCLIILIMQVCGADGLKRSVHVSVRKLAVVVHCINRSSSLKLQFTCFKSWVLLAPACILAGLHKTDLRNLTTCKVTVVVTGQAWFNRIKTFILFEVLEGPNETNTDLNFRLNLFYRKVFSLKVVELYVWLLCFGIF